MNKEKIQEAFIRKDSESYTMIEKVIVYKLISEIETANNCLIKLKQKINDLRQSNK